MTITVPFQPLPLDQTDVLYAHGPDSFVRPGVPTGRLVEFDWHTSTVYPGTVYVDEENLHTWKTARIGQIRADVQLDIVWTSEAPVHPVPYAVYRTRRQWDELLAGLYAGWGGSWAQAPA